MRITSVGTIKTTTDPALRKVHVQRSKMIFLLNEKSNSYVHTKAMY